MKILYVITELDEGGAEQSLCRLVLGLDRAQFEPLVAYMAGKAPLAAELNARSVKTIALGMGEISPETTAPSIGKRAAEFKTAARRLSEAIESFKPDVVHAWLFHASFLSRAVLRGKGGPLLVTSVRVAEPRISHRTAEKLTKGWNHHWVCVSEGVRRRVVELGIPAEKTTVIPNGVDAVRFSRRPPPGGAIENDEFLESITVRGWGEARRRAREKCGVERDEPLIAAVGRLHEQKGHDVLLRAFALGGFAEKGARLVIAGDGPMRADLEGLAGRLGIKGGVLMPGRFEDVRPLLLAADVFVSASRWEGMCNAVMEAMAMETPVIATDVAGSSELILPEKTGLLVPTDNPEAIAAALKRILSDKKYAAEMAAAARRHVAENFTIEKMVRRHEDLYRNLSYYFKAHQT